MNIKTTPIAVSVHRSHDSPVFGETATHVSIEDEAGGPFVVIKQHFDDIKPGTVRLELEELEAVVKAARRLMKAHEETI